MKIIGERDRMSPTAVTITSCRIGLSGCACMSNEMGWQNIKDNYRIPISIDVTVKCPYYKCEEIMTHAILYVHPPWCCRVHWLKPSRIMSKISDNCWLAPIDDVNKLYFRNSSRIMSNNLRWLLTSSNWRCAYIFKSRTRKPQWKC